MKFKNLKKIQAIVQNLEAQHKKMIIIGTCLLAGAFFVGFYFFFFADKEKRTAVDLIIPTIKMTPKEDEAGRGEVSEVPPTPSPTEAEDVESGYKIHRGIYSTMFWVGEDATEANAYIPNKASAWDSAWMEHFGGIDNPYERNGYYPKDFKPRENPFYFALPYNDLDGSGKKVSAAQIPWYTGDNSGSLLKNRWIKVTSKDRVCYGQWQDVGPFETDDFDYVFGDAEPKNRVGLDLSPAMRDCLHMVTNGNVDWQFIDEGNVPNGPWREIVTTSQLNW